MYLNTISKLSQKEVKNRMVVINNSTTYSGLIIKRCALSGIDIYTLIVYATTLQCLAISIETEMKQKITRNKHVGSTKVRNISKHKLTCRRTSLPP